MRGSFPQGGLRCEGCLDLMAGVGDASAACPMADHESSLGVVPNRSASWFTPPLFQTFGVRAAPEGRARSQVSIGGSPLWERLWAGSGVGNSVPRRGWAEEFSIAALAVPSFSMAVGRQNSCVTRG